MPDPGYWMVWEWLPAAIIEAGGLSRKKTLARQILQPDALLLKNVAAAFLCCDNIF
jgi:hypothetical protein